MRKLLYTFLAVSIIFSSCEKNDIGTYQVSLSIIAIENYRGAFTKEGVAETITNTKTGEIVSLQTITRRDFYNLYRMLPQNTTSKAGTYQTATTTGKSYLPIKMWKEIIYQTTINTKTGKVVSRSVLTANSKDVNRSFQRYKEAIEERTRISKEELGTEEEVEAPAATE